MSRRLPGATLLLLAIAVGAHGQSVFWERPDLLSAAGVRFSSVAVSRQTLVAAWEEIVPAASKTEGSIYLSVAARGLRTDWRYRYRILGPIRYSGLDPGSEPLVYSMAVDGGRILLAVATGEREIAIYEGDGQLAFRQLTRLSTQVSVVTPTLFVTAKGSLVLLAVTQSSRAGEAPGAPVSILWARSTDGRAWSSLSAFVGPNEPGAGVQLQPDHVTFQGKEIVVFQSQRSVAEGYQIFAKISPDGGETWQPAQAVTSLPAFDQAVGGSLFKASNFSNARPRLRLLGDSLAMAWERNLLGVASPVIYYSELNERAEVTRAAEAVSAGNPGIMAQPVRFGGRDFLLYAESVAGAYRIVLSEHVGGAWIPSVVGRTLTGSSRYPQGVEFGGEPLVFWETTSTAGTALVELKQKTRVAAPALAAVGFAPGRPSRADRATIRWKQPDDSVGIDYYEVSLLLDGVAQETDRRVDAVSTDMTLTRQLSRDGSWRFAVKSVDLAGNRSPPATIDLLRDTVPPRAVTLAPPPMDASGQFAASNSFTVDWTPASGDTDIVGYTWEEQRVSSSLAGYEANPVKLIEPPARVLTTEQRLSFVNLENGVYVISVRALDQAGNLGEPARIVLPLNKFQPYTFVYTVIRTTDDLGNVQLTVRGRGFISNGAVREVYLSRTDVPPYDRVFRPDGFRVVSDTQITGPVLDNSMPSGSYRLGVLQASSRPYFWPGGRIDFQAPGTVRFANLSILLPRWVAGSMPRYSLPIEWFLVPLVLVMLVLLGVLSVRRMAAITREGMRLRSEVVALLESRPLAGWEERKSQMKELRRRGVGLRLKFTLLMVVLVTIIVLIVSIPLGVQMTSRQSLALADSLQKRTKLLIGALAASAESNLRLGAIDGGLNMLSVPDAVKSMDEALNATITGPGDTTSGSNPDPNLRDYVWASNAEVWKKKTADRTFVVAVQPESDPLSARVPDLQKTVNDAAAKAVQAELADYQKSRDRQAQIESRRNRTTAENNELAALLNARPKLVAAIDAGLKQLPEGGVRSEPAFDPVGSLAPSYLFYKPIVYFNPVDRSFYQGLVRMGVDTSAITRGIRDARDSILRVTALVALVAIGLGVLGAIIMASITVTPIRRLAAGVEIIRDTEDKEQLKGHTIRVRTRDEIGVLADTVNAMTQGLVKAAIANKELLLGKDVQKMFLPLEKGGENLKGTTAGEEDAQAALYGYYEGAKGVSGDYFDFRKLDEAHYALIKCDVAGKGVPAALIMVEVATLFLNFVREWPRRREAVAKLKDPAGRQKAQQDLERIDTLVYTINDMLEERGFKGRFAALTVCIFNSRTGVVTTCSAGDSIMHLYDSGRKQMIQRKLPETPAAGVFPSMMIEMKSGFPMVTQAMNHGDVLFLFTDGFEEAKRSFRNADYDPIPCQAPEVAEGETHLGTHTRGQTTEEFGIARIQAVVTAAFNRGRYQLVRHHTADSSEELVFDFSSCAGTVQDAVLALVAVEKVYRLVADPRAGEGNRIAVDGKVEGFLKKHFLPYARYFGHPVDADGPVPTVTFSHLREDEQYDDLTILVLKRK